ncbi:hypothetical protein [Aeromicrobium sp. CnD17-E]|uniref:hypothetical protein n=1 Tax=Aeromicrobium sp. CnD17-E TaxID=2954487 RepID=UPI002098092A|nr:hypothetical protein [Aeromicrobium sp. CnD17-E]
MTKLVARTSASATNIAPDERGPQDESLRPHLAALDQLDPNERNSIRARIECALLRHQARRLAETS